MAAAPTADADAAVAASSGLSSDHPDLVCAVCMQAFNTLSRRPIDIGCHTFCEACILASPASFRRCPECRAAARNPHINYALMRLLGSLSSPPSGSPPTGQANGYLHTEPHHGRSLSGNGWPRRSSSEGLAGSAASPSLALDALRAEIQHGHDEDGGGLNAGWGLHAAAAAAQGASSLSNLWHRRPSGAPRPGAMHLLPAWGVPPGAGPGMRASAPPPLGQSSSPTHRGPGTGPAAEEAGGRAARAGARGPGQGPGRGEPSGPGHTFPLGEGVGGSHQLVSAAVSHLPNAVQEARSTFWSWAGPLLGLLYLVSPLDLIPDFIPLMGWLDDMVVVGALLYWVFCLARTQQQVQQGGRRLIPPTPPPTPPP